MKNTIVFALIAALTACVGAQSRAGGESAHKPADCLLKPHVVDPPEIRYQPRDGRCEGRFAEAVSGDIQMHVVGFHLGPLIFDPKNREPIWCMLQPRIGQVSR
jgi:hypothetical protein